MQTQKYKKSLSGSIGAGMKSLVGGGGRQLYVLEHKISSRYYKAGEEQQIIVDQIEIGRDSHCAVCLRGRTDDDPMFGIVSRKHAAIQRDGDNWKLIHLSETNATILNGTRMTTVGQEWYLQSGDEIQLAGNGPKLCFKIPQGAKGRVGSIGLSARLSLFRKQALRPYKTAITALSCLLLLIAAGGGWWIYDLSRKLIDMESSAQRTMTEFEEQIRQDSIDYANMLESEKQRHQQEIANLRDEMLEAISNAEGQTGATGINALLASQNINKDVYFIFTNKVVLEQNGREIVIDSLQWCGTGFLLNDGRFVTARHCIEGWWYNDFTANTMAAQAARMAASVNGCRIKGYYTAVSSIAGVQFEFTSDDFKMNHSLDQKAQIGTDESGNPLYWNFPYPANNSWDPKMWATDWAYTTQTHGKRGGLEADPQLSRSLQQAQDMIVMGFPQGLGVNDGNEVVEPIFNEVTVSRAGLANNGCILHSRGTDHGNSGGPIFALKNGQLVVVGIVSRGDMRTSEYNWAVPVSCLQ